MTTKQCEGAARRMVVGLVGVMAVVTGVLFLRLGLHSEGWDWYLSEFQATVAYSALLHYGEVPWFSYLVNGGEPLLINPQGLVASPTVLWVLLCGPRAGLRWAVGMHAGLGVVAMWLWLRRHIGELGALCAGVGWILSLGFFWRVAVGNDMFMWHVFLPAVLWGVDEVWDAPGWRSAAKAAVVGVVLGYGPVFHAAFYVLIPGLIIWVLVRVFEAIMGGKSVREKLVRAIAWGMVSGIIVAVVCLPRLAMWMQVPMGRKIWFDGVPRWVEAVRGLVDGRLVTVRWLPRVGGGTWGVWETSVALSWMATGAAVLGAIVGIRRAARVWVYAVILIGVGFVLATNFALYRWLFEVTRGQFRVPDRFLMLSSFGLAVLSGCGISAMGAWLPRYVVMALTVLYCAWAVGQAWWWQEAAQRVKTVRAERLPLMDHRRLLRRAGLGTCAVRSNTGEVIFSGNMAVRLMPQPGNDWNMVFAREVAERQGVVPVVTSLTGKIDVSLSHRSIELRDLMPGAEVIVRVLPSLYGECVEVEPADAEVRLLRGRDHLRICNTGSVTARGLRVRARIPTWWRWCRADRGSGNVRFAHDGGLVRNGGFDEGLACWELWNAAQTYSNAVRIVPTWTSAGMRYALRIENPHRALVGVAQRVALKSNTVYRLGGAARSLATTASDILFGGRLAVWQPPQAEREIVWMSEYNDWWQKYLVFTNEVSGTAVLYVHLGYGNVATSGEFTNITLEELLEL